MVKTQWQFTHHEMEIMIQAVVIVFLNKRSVCHRDYNSPEPVRLQSLLFGDSFTQISWENWALTFLKQYSYEQVLSHAADCTPKTFHKRVLEVLIAMNKRYNDVVSTKFTNFNPFFRCIKSNFS